MHRLKPGHSDARRRLRRPSVVRAACLLLVLVAISPGALESRAGGLLQVGPVWRFYSFLPKDSESTPNYEGYGLDLAGGYSIKGVLDVALLAQYTPGRLGRASLTGEDSSLFSLGGLLGATFARHGYLGLYGGQAYYSGTRHSGRDNLVKGIFNGPAAGITAGATWGKSTGQGGNRLRLQVFAERAWLSGRQDEAAEIERRSLSAFGLGLIWVFKDSGEAAWENSIMGGFINSLGI